MANGPRDTSGNPSQKDVPLAGQKMLARYGHPRRHNPDHRIAVPTPQPGQKRQEGRREGEIQPEARGIRHQAPGRPPRQPTAAHREVVKRGRR